MNVFAPPPPPPRPIAGPSSTSVPARMKDTGSNESRQGSSKYLNDIVSEPPKKKARGQFKGGRIESSRAAVFAQLIQNATHGDDVAVTALKDAYQTPDKMQSPDTRPRGMQTPSRSNALSADRREPYEKVNRPLTTPLRFMQPHRSDAKEAVSPPKSLKASAVTPPSARAANLFKALRPDRAMHASEHGEVKPLTEAVPVLPASIADLDTDARGEVPDDWSPRKKKGGHVV